MSLEGYIMNVGERIKQIRNDLGMSQDELAKKVGYRSRSSIQKIEASRNLPLRKVTKMAIALGCTESYLMGWTNDPHSVTASGHTPGEVVICAPVEKERSSRKINELLKDKTPEEQAEIVDLLTKLLSIPPEGRSHLLELLKSLVPHS